jgi:DNA modification methylase
MCGDSTLKSDVDKLLNGAKPILMCTDPPYGVNYDPEWRVEARAGSVVSSGKIVNDDRANWYEAYALFSGDIAYVWHAGIYAHIVAEELISLGFTIVSQIIWNKANGAISRGDIHWKHEPCWYAVRKGKNHNWQGARDVWTVWDIKNGSSKSVQEEEGQTGHGAQKPLECMARPIRNNTEAGEAVYDPFLGSGTTLIASDRLSRICFGMEISPNYIEMIIRRYAENCADENGNVQFEHVNGSLTLEDIIANANRQKETIEQVNE